MNKLNMLEFIADFESLNNVSSDREELEVLKRLRICLDERIFDITHYTSMGYNKLFRDCLFSIVNPDNKSMNPEIYREYENLRGSLVKDINANTKVMTRSEYKFLISKLQSKGYTINKFYEEV